MATLNIENFPDEIYEQLQRRAEREHRSLAQEVVHILEKSVEEPELHSILELRGLGKELWEGIDPVEHVRTERDSWTSDEWLDGLGRLAPVPLSAPAAEAVRQAREDEEGALVDVHDRS